MTNNSIAHDIEVVKDEKISNQPNRKKVCKNLLKKLNDYLSFNKLIEN